MLLRIFILTTAGALVAPAVLLDRISIVIGKSIVKHSDIERDVRVTEFLNGEPLNIGPGPRKAATNRLIDQVFIRREIIVGDYSEATPQDADRQLGEIRKERYKTDQAFTQALHRYGLDPTELRSQFQWQLTVLQFIDARFRPAAYVSDAEVEQYFRQHAAALKRETGKSSLDDLRQYITNIIAGEKVNKLFFDWLDSQRKDTSITYLEPGLQ